MGLLDALKKVRDLLPARQRRQAIWLFLLMTVVGCLETVGIASILPFIVVASRPETLRGEGLLADIYRATGLSSEHQFLILLGAAVFLLLLISNIVKAFSSWKTFSYTNLFGQTIAERLIRSYLSQPYDYFLGRNSSELGKNVLSEVQEVVQDVIQPGMIVAARSIVVIFLAGLLIVSDPYLAVTAVLVFGGAYGILYVFTRARASRQGIKRVQANRERFHTVAEAFSGIKEVKLRGLEHAYASRFAASARRYAKLQAANQTLSQVPRYALEVLAFGSVVLLVIYLLATRDGMAEALPVIALYAFAGYRLLPNVQEIFGGLARMRFTKPALDSLHRDFAAKTAEFHETESPVAPMAVTQSISLKDVSYRYPSGEKPAVSGIDIVIPKGARVGFVGPTGSGKSTIVDVLVGLLRPTTGTLQIDGVDLETSAQLRAWRSAIGYVPQRIFLADDTVAANIAFGDRSATPEMARVERAARIAQIHEFVVTALPEKYETKVGENGVRLSGGQQQRLGLARALYNAPTVVIFDEATSALDNKTEDEVMAALDQLDSDCTVIMIAHRLRTLAKCSIVFEVSGGRIIRTGSFAEIVRTHEDSDGG